MPINIADNFFRSFQNEVVPVCLKQNVGVIGMKGIAGGHPQGRLIEKLGLTSDECYRYCLTVPVTSQVVGINTMEHLKKNVALARSFKPYTAAEKETLFARVKNDCSDGRHELFKSTQVFDGPHHRKQHGFDLA
jgi:predicted aldo/keto reductase-like oxidoreductase